jgi:hypothetical protein
VSDIGEPRLYLPELNDVNLTPSIIWKVIKDLIGKDMSRVEMPAFINESSSVLQRQSEFMFHMSALTEASQFGDSAKRMAWVASAIIQSFYQIVYRLKKPFNPLLAETYELVTSDFRFYSEMVSHHPPILCVNGQGKNYEMNFTGDC